jgi:CheY-like chemotaxis protein
MSGLKKQELKIGFADYPGLSFGVCLCKFIRSKISDKYNVKDRWSYYGDELLEFAKTGAVDIFILNLNCITNSDETLDLRERLEHSYKIITQIKTTYPYLSIIAHSAWSNQHERAKSAGADFYFQDPFELENFMEAFEKCLEMLSGFNDVLRKRFKENAGYTITNQSLATYH